MADKGLCISCVNGIECVLPSRFPILECEEFSIHRVTPREDKRAESKKQKPAMKRSK